MAEAQRRFHVLQFAGPLVAASDADLDPTFTRYSELYYRVTAGYPAGSVDALTTARQAHFTYFHTLAWDGQRLCLTAKPGGDGASAASPTTERFSTFPCVR